ncbi:MAG: hypothetical protein ACYTEL_21535 [Planctomycetota bacterium]|jgi:rubrerythrin
MRAITIGNILEHVENFENSVTEFFEYLHDKTHDEGAKLLTDYIARHRHRTLAALDRLPHEQIEHLKKLPLQYQPHIPGAHCFEKIKLSSDSTPLTILEAAIEFDECLVQMYRQISEQPVAHEIKDLFDSLAKYEEADEMHLKKTRQMFSR